VFLVVVNHVTVALDFFLKVLPEFLSGKFSPTVGCLLVVACDYQTNLGIQYRHIVRQFVERSHQVHNAGKENWKHRKCSLLNQLAFGFQFLSHIVVTEEVREDAASVRDVAASVREEAASVSVDVAEVSEDIASVKEDAA